jgi:hypothetical protein
MTNEKFERLQVEKFKHLSLDELNNLAGLDTLFDQHFPRHSDYTLADEISNEIDRRENLPMSKRVK